MKSPISVIFSFALVVSTSSINADWWNFPTGAITTSHTTTKIGIGVLAPVNMLDVEGGMVVGANAAGTYTAPLNGLLVEGNVGIGTSTPVAKLDVIGSIKAGSQVAYGTPMLSGFQNSSTSQASGVAGRTTGTGYYTVGVAGVENAGGSYNIAGWFWSQGTAGNRYGLLAFANGGSHAYPAGQWAGAFMGNTYVERDLQVGGKIIMKN